MNEPIFKTCAHCGSPSTYVFCLKDEMHTVSCSACNVTLKRKHLEPLVRTWNNRIQKGIIWKSFEAAVNNVKQKEEK